MVEEGDVVMLGVVLQQLHHLLHVVVLEAVGAQPLFELGFRDTQSEYASIMSIPFFISLAFIIISHRDRCM